VPRRPHAGWAKGDAWIIGWLLQTKALIMIIFVNVPRCLIKHCADGDHQRHLHRAAVDGRGSTMLTVPRPSSSTR
jgi:hypothetical protein